MLLFTTTTTSCIKYYSYYILLTYLDDSTEILKMLTPKGKRNIQKNVFIYIRYILKASFLDFIYIKYYVYIYILYVG